MKLFKWLKWAWTQRKEKEVRHIKEMREINKELEQKREEIEKDYKKFKELSEKALFSNDPEEAFKASIILARLSGVPEENILKSKEDIDQYFLGGEKS